MIATSDGRDDDAIADFCATARAACFRGPLENVAAVAPFVQDLLGARLYVSLDPQAEPRSIDDDYVGLATGDMLPSFVAAILDGGAPEVATTDVLDVMGVSLAIERAAASNQTVAIAYS